MAAKYKFIAQRQAARQRGIEWNLSFEEWSNIWKESCRWDQRGPGNDQYCMCRYGDEGVYETGNVFIGLADDNKREANKRRAVLRKSTTISEGA